MKLDLSSAKPYEQQTLVEKLRNRAAIRRQASTRKSVQEGKPDRLADLLEEAADEIERKSSM
jgi:hypothetical protein